MAKENSKTVGQNRKYSSNLNSNIVSLNSTYIGFVQSTTDFQKMGRLEVWIPSINRDKTIGTFMVSYASPFAGASPVEGGGQTSYGFWAVPPDINNEVIVLFIDGDPNKGVWIGCLYQQYMNNMVPGIGTSAIAPNGSKSGPSMEYDKTNQSLAASSMDPPRPEYAPLAEGITTQGLTGDNFRGPSTSSARRDDSATVLGILSPNGSQFVMDDAADDTFIRMRTKSGTQVLVNDTIGMVYIISKNGNSWAEISDEGVDVYSSGAISMRSHGDFNIHSDANINMFGAAVNITSVGAMNIASGSDLNQLIGGKYNVNSNAQMSIVSNGSLVMTSNSDLGIDSGGSLALRGCSEIGITACGTIAIKGSKVQQNSGSGPTPGTANTATTKDISQVQDVSLSSGYGETKTSTTVSRLVTHEPFAGHPTAPAVSSSSSTSTTTNASTATKNTSASTTSTATAMKAPQTWWIPVSGKVKNTYQEKVALINPEGHPGVYVTANPNTSIISSKRGKVVWAGEGTSGSGYSGYGNCVCIDHLDGYKTIYGHMSKIRCKVGDVVKQGQPIGQVGNQTSKYGSNVHFEIRKNGSRIDPSSVIKTLGNKGNKIQAGIPLKG